MTYPEAIFCKRQEYEEFENDRLDCEDLTVGELYSTMFLLDENANRREAAKLPARVQGIAREAGLYVVRLTFYDQDFKPTVKTDGQFEGGMWVDVRDKITVTDKQADKQYIPSESYIMPYEDPDEKALQEIAAQNSLVLVK